MDNGIIEFGVYLFECFDTFDRSFCSGPGGKPGRLKGVSNAPAFSSAPHEIKVLVNQQVFSQ